jgi:microcompartment protein CcmK/EutM
LSDAGRGDAVLLRIGESARQRGHDGICAADR